MKRLALPWNDLARGVPFRRWEWLYSWWRHYGQGRTPFVLTVRDEDDALVGLAPWFVEDLRARGRVVRFLGSGEVCSDHLSILTQEGREDDVAETLARWLTEAAAADAANGTAGHRWDLLELSGVDVHDEAVMRLIEHLRLRGNTIHRRGGPNCWRIELPDTWEQYLAMLSKSHRKQIRRVERRMEETGRIRLKTVDSRDDLQIGLDLLVDLHRRRRRSLGEKGCFSSQAFSGFVQETAERFLHDGYLRLCWVELDARPIAAELQIAGQDVTYAYQAGINPKFLDEEPGRLINIATIKRAIDEGHRGFDFLRGDEPYKAHWRAEPCKTVRYRVVPQRTLARVRHGVWLAGDSVKNWIKSGLAMTGMV